MYMKNQDTVKKQVNIAVFQVFQQAQGFQTCKTFVSIWLKPKNQLIISKFKALPARVMISQKVYWGLNLSLRLAISFPRQNLAASLQVRTIGTTNGIIRPDQGHNRQSPLRMTESFSPGIPCSAARKRIVTVRTASPLLKTTLGGSAFLDALIFYGIPAPVYPMVLTDKK